jgi:hypothetical protein
VLYLTDGWAETDGGALCLYDTDDDKHPKDVKEKIQPIENSLILFRVQHDSWHSVEEVLVEKQRLSLNGWFHYPESAEIPTFGSEAISEENIGWIKPTMGITLTEINAWLNPKQVDAAKVCDEWNDKNRDKAHIMLVPFLNATRYDEVLAELEAAEFERCGPPDIRNVWQLVESKLTEGSVLRSLLRLLRSEKIKKLLTRWTGVPIYDWNDNKTTTGLAKGFLKLFGKKIFENAKKLS